MFILKDRVEQTPTGRIGTVTDRDDVRREIKVEWDDGGMNFWVPSSQLRLYRVEENTMFKAGDRVHHTVSENKGTVKGVYHHVTTVAWDDDPDIQYAHPHNNLIKAEDNTFWVVWAPAASNPTVKHESEDSARHEAERLSKKHPGRQFHVLKCIGSVKTENNPTTEWT